MNELACSIARNLLKIEAVKFNFNDPYTWTSGIKSPVYCDNRLSLSHPELRSMIRDAYVSVIQEKFSDVEVIAAVATGAIPQGALVADQLGKPLVYVRDRAKNCGMGKTIEGTIKIGQKVVIIEDHVSTGMSSLKVFEELKNADTDVLGMIATLSYDLPIAEKRFKNNNLTLITLSKFSILMEEALKCGYITEEEVDKLYKWCKSIDYE